MMRWMPRLREDTMACEHSAMQGSIVDTQSIDMTTPATPTAMGGWLTAAGTNIYHNRS